MYPAVGIIILNWKDENDTLRCLSSLEDLDYPKKITLVVDNGSPPESIVKIRVQFPNIPILDMGENSGYTGGNNAGIQWMLQRNVEWVLLLNNDTTIEKNSLRELINTGQKDPQIGIVGPTVYYSTPNNLIQSAGGILDKHWRAYHRGQDQLDNGQFLIRRIC